MPKKAKELTAIEVRNRHKQQKNGRFAVGGVDGLHLRTLGESSSWILRAVIRAEIGGTTTVNRRDIGLGAYPLITLAEARDAARELLKQIQKGIDPVIERKHKRQSASKSTTFEETALKYIDIHAHGWKNQKHIQQWRNTLKQYAFPIIGKASPSQISCSDVLAVLQQKVENDKIFWFAKTETASRVRLRIERVLASAVDYPTSLNKTNPASVANIKKHLPAVNKTKSIKHFPALPYREIGQFIAALQDREGIAAKAIEFLIYTACRSGEVRGMTWDEVNLTDKVWLIPKSRMKADQEHTVPLSDRAISILESLPKLSESPFVFPSPTGVQLSDMSLTAVLRRMNHSDITVHGFRSSFRDWAGEQTHHSRQTIEFALAHQLKDQSEAAYLRGNLLDKRRDLMKDWTTYCNNRHQHTQNVFPIDKNFRAPLPNEHI